MKRDPSHTGAVATAPSDPPPDDPRQPVVTIEMVARAAGVSPSTVSRILNGTAVVSDAKAHAVEAAIARLGYVPNPVARGLAGGRTLSIGVVTQSLDSPFYGAALRGVEIALQAAGYSPLFISGQWNDREEQRCVAVLLARRVDGIILLDARLSDQALLELARALPVVVTGRTLAAPQLASLSFDNFLGACQATGHLLDLGHRRIAFIAGAADHQDAVERQRGFRHAMRARRVAVDETLVVAGDYSEQSGAQAIEQLLGRGAEFTAVFAANDQMALGAMLGLHRHKVAVPQDVSVVGFDDLQAGHFCIPPLTSVHQPSREMGQLAARAMVALLSGERADLRLPEPRLIARDSSARRRA